MANQYTDGLVRISFDDKGGFTIDTNYLFEPRSKLNSGEIRTIYSFDDKGFLIHRKTEFCESKGAEISIAVDKQIYYTPDKSRFWETGLTDPRFLPGLLDDRQLYQADRHPCAVDAIKLLTDFRWGHNFSWEDRRKTEVAINNLTPAYQRTAA